MSILPTNVAQSLAGLSQAERAEAREKSRPEAVRAKDRRGKDETDLVVVDNQSADAVRSLKGNDQEEAREDRQAKQGYRPDGSAKKSQEKRLDVQG